MNIPGSLPIHPRETFWQWRVLELDKRGKEKWRTLGWRMNEVDAPAWAAKNGKRLEKVAGSGEDRASGPYVGWGQELQDDPGRVG